MDNPPVFNKGKAGSAVPVKFSLGGDFGLSIFAAGYPLVTPLQCQNGTVDPIEETVSSVQSKLTYDPLTGKYIYVWKTNKAWSNTCRVLTLKFIDGTEKTALFKFTK